MAGLQNDRRMNKGMNYAMCLCGKNGMAAAKHIRNSKGVQYLEYKSEAERYKFQLYNERKNQNETFTQKIKNSLWKKQG